MRAGYANSGGEWYTGRCDARVDGLGADDEIVNESVGVIVAIEIGNNVTESVDGVVECAIGASVRDWAGVACPW